MKNRNLRRLISFALAIVTAVSVIGGGWLTTEVEAVSNHTYILSPTWVVPPGQTRVHTGFDLQLQSIENVTFSLTITPFVTGTPINVRVGLRRSGTNTIDPVRNVTTANPFGALIVTTAGVYTFAIQNNSASDIMVIGTYTVETNPTSLRYVIDPTLFVGISSVMMNDIQRPFEQRWGISYNRSVLATGPTRLSQCPNPNKTTNLCSCVGACHSNASINLGEVKGRFPSTGRQLSNIFVSARLCHWTGSCRLNNPGQACAGALGIAEYIGAKWTYTNFTWTNNNDSRIGTIWHEMSHMYGVSESTNRPCQVGRMCIMNGGFGNLTLAQVQAQFGGNIWCSVCVSEFRPHLH
jgi:hypothetical protein